MNDLEMTKKGFNAGYLLEKYDPDLARKLLKDLKDKDIPYAVGYKAGVKEMARERIMEQYKSNAKAQNRDRNFSKDR